MKSRFTKVAMIGCCMALSIVLISNGLGMEGAQFPKEENAPLTEENPHLTVATSTAALAATCGEYIYDDGGPDGPYPPFSSQEMLLCPDVPGQFVTLDFEEFDVLPCCANLNIFDGHFGPGLATLNGQDLPRPVNATNPTGCLHLQFNNFYDQTASGWKALTGCVDCPTVNWVAGYGATYHSVYLQWSQVQVAVSFDWEVGPVGFAPGTGSALASGNATDGNILVDGLQSDSEYEAHVRVVCLDGNASVWRKTAFRTAPTCGDSFFDAGGPNGDYPLVQDVTTTICPDQQGAFASLKFQEFDLAPCCAYMQVFDSEYFGGGFIGYFTEDNSPGTVTATNQSGCLTVHFFNQSDGVTTAAGWAAEVSCVTCPNPSMLTANSPTVNSVGISWNPTSIASYYYWEIGPEGFAPGTGQAAFSGNSNANDLFVTGLESGTFYDVYVQAKCGANDESPFTGPVHFSTTPSCGDSFYDPGGPNGNYGPYTYTNTILCPDVPGQFVELTFNEIDLGGGASVTVLNGANPWDNQLLSFGQGSPPVAVAATNATGCLNVQFTNYVPEGGVGWEASIVCVTCPFPSNLLTNYVTANSVELYWVDFSPTNIYEWEIGPDGFSPGNGEALFSGSTAEGQVSLNGLESSTAYDVYVRTVCNGSDPSHFAGPLSFTTSPTCGDPFYDPGGPNGSASLNQLVTTVVCPDVPGQFVSVDFDGFNFDSCCSYLEVYDGMDNTGITIGSYHSNANVPTVLNSTHPTGCLYFYFYNYGAATPDWSATVNCVDCPSPNNLFATNSLPGAVQVTWWEMANANSYDWEIGLQGFEPNTGNAVKSGNTPLGYVEVDGLESSTHFDVYVRTVCSGSAGVSTYSGPFSFMTPPACGDTFYDDGGPNGDYAPYGSYQLYVCPDQPGEYVQVDFTEFDLEECCAYLEVYDDGLLGQFTGSELPPSLVSNSSSGCMIINFSNNTSDTAPGWAADITCVTCPKPNDYWPRRATVSSLGFTCIGVTGSSINWEVGLPGFVPGTGNAVQSGNSNLYDITVNGLESGTEYEVYLQSKCGSDASAFSGPLRMSTAPTCGGHFYDPAGPNANTQGFISNLTTVICPDVPGQMVEVTFNSFELDPSENVSVFNGEEAIDAIGFYQGSFGPQSPITASNPSGCLTFTYYGFGTGIYSGWDASVNCITCPAVLGLGLADAGLNSAELTWSATLAASSYEWEVGLPGFVPGTGAAIASGTSATNSAQVNGLVVGTYYDAYVRPLCGPNDVGSWSDSFYFQTDITCGGFYYDPGGPNGNYDGFGIDITTVICPDNGGAVSVAFAYFNINAWDMLSVHNGNSINSPLLETAMGNMGIPGPYTASNPTGCLTFHFVADEGGTWQGWEAAVTCGGCTSPNNFTLVNVDATTANFEWEMVGTANSYNWEVGLPGFSPGIGQAVQVGNSSANSVTVNGLGANKDYEAYLRSICGGNEPSAFAGPLAFSTSPSGTSDLGAFLARFEITPNPVGDQLTLRFDYRKDETLSLTLTDLTGRVVLEQQVNALLGENTVRVEVSALPSGPYFVGLKGGLGMAVRKVVKW